VSNGRNSWSIPKGKTTQVRNVEPADIAAARTRQAIRQARPHLAATASPRIVLRGRIVEMTTPVMTSPVLVCGGESNHQGNRIAMSAAARLRQAIRQLLSCRAAAPSPQITAKGAIVGRKILATADKGGSDLSHQWKSATVKPPGMAVGMSEKCSR
jgi:hypothetical protein